MEFWTYIGIIAVGFVGVKFVKQLGTGVPILEVMLLIAGLQWIIGPTIEYMTPSFHYRYYMYVPQGEYMSFVVPAYLAFTVIVLWQLKRIPINSLPIESLKNYADYGLVIFWVGVAFDLLGKFLPGSLGFLAFILSNFKYVGAIILYFSERKRHRNFFYGALLYLFISSLARAMFHDLILWSMFFYMFWAVKYKPSIKTILLTFLASVFLLTTLQTIKAAYRAEIWSGYSGNKVELFLTLMGDAIFSGGTNTQESDQEVNNNVRLNQGWIISAIMDNIPGSRPYFQGTTITEAVFSSALPRFLNPNKKEAGGQENFKEFTGLYLSNSTSMGISIIGEAYGNYGVFGGILFMAFWGLFLVKVWLWLYNKGYSNVLFIAFLPLIFLQVIKAETELVVVLNHLIKSIIVIWLFFEFAKKFLNWNLSLTYEN
ncbi:hypothetical protein GCM10028791_39090 [Echinicola sediminis]